MRPAKSLRNTLLIHELLFIALIVLAVGCGSYGIRLWDQSAKESARISLLIHEIEQTRGDLYRQMKELYDATFLTDTEAKGEYAEYTQLILEHFQAIKKLTAGTQEQQALADLERNYRAFVSLAPSEFARFETERSEKSRKILYKDLETGIFTDYEKISQRAESMLSLKQIELESRLKDAKQTSKILLAIPIMLSGLLLLFSRTFLRRAIIQPINALIQATSEISNGNLSHKVPETGAAELAALSNGINKMATELASSRDALVQSEKQAALGLLVPMLAHNIRNPLASIRATAQVIDLEEDDLDNLESVHGIIGTVDRLERWTGNLLAYLRPTKPQLNTFEMAKILDHAILPLRAKMKEKKIALNINNQLNQLIVTDEHLLEQTLYNLILNAIEASPNQSAISVHMQHIAWPTTVKIKIIDQGAGLSFTPIANAAGLSPSTKRFGTGLGIPFVYKACELLGAQINFSANSDKGTTVHLSLPQ